jgi:hypothetical protein
MANVKLKPDQPRRFYVGIDVTGTVDTLAWGQAWHNTFGWDNLLLKLSLDPTDKAKLRRIDKAHPKLPVAQLFRNRKITVKKDGKEEEKTITSTDTCLLPEGVDKATKAGFKASGTYDLWPGADAASNVTEMNDAARFMQTFILNPRVDSAKSELSDTAGDAVADVVYISSHGFSFGDMPGDVGFTMSGVESIFLLGRIAAKGGQFAGPSWLLLSNCSTLSSSAQPDWVRVMNGSTPLRGIIGFQNSCPSPESSANLFIQFISLLAQGKTFVEAWKTTLTNHGMATFWVVLCHENAAGDKITDFHGASPKPIPAGTSKIFVFDDAHPTGVQVAVPADPFEAFWTKGATRITPANRSDAANLLAAKDKVTITVRPPATPGTPPTPPTPGTFAAGTQVSITLIYIRVDYPEDVDVTKLFKVDSVTNGALRSPKATDRLNVLRPAPHNKADDSWVVDVAGTPSELVLNLTCLDLTSFHHHNVPLRVKVSFGTLRHDFVNNGAIQLS